MASIRRAAIRRQPIDDPQTLNQFLSQEFRESRLRKGLTMRSVSAACGLSIAFICDFENAVRGISCESFYVLMEAIGKKPHQGFHRAVRKFERLKQLID